MLQSILLKGPGEGAGEGLQPVCQKVGGTLRRLNTTN